MALPLQHPCSPSPSNYKLKLLFFFPLCPSSLPSTTLSLRRSTIPSVAAPPPTPNPSTSSTALSASNSITPLPADRHQNSYKKKEMEKEKEKKGHVGPLPAALRALEASGDPGTIQEALDPFAGKLSPKELTLVLLREQRDWRRALQVFHWMRSKGELYTPNLIHYNVVLRALGRACEWDKLHLCWLDMARDGVPPTNTTYSILIYIFGKAGLVKEATLWLRHMRSRGVFPDEVTMTTMVSVFKEWGLFNRGERFFRDWCSGKVDLESLELDSEGEQPDVDRLSPTRVLLTQMLRSGGQAPVSKISSAASPAEVGCRRKPKTAGTYNVLIDLYAKSGRLKDASEMFAEMLDAGVAPDTATFNTMIKVCWSYGRLSEAEALLKKMEERRLRPNTRTFNIFISMCASAGNVEGAMVYYRKIKESGLKADVLTYREILKALCERRMVGEMEGVVEEMQDTHARVDEKVMPRVIRMYVEEGLVERAKMFFRDHCSTRQISSKTHAAIMDIYADKGLWMEAEDVFYSKRATLGPKDTMEYNVMIKAYGKAKLYDKAVSLFEGMASSGAWPNDCSYNSIIQMLAVGDLPEKASNFLTRMRKAGMRPRCETYGAVIASNARGGMVGRAEDIFRRMKQFGPPPDELVYRSLIDAFAESGNVEKALHYFHMMQSSGVAISRNILTSLMKAHSKMGRWRAAQLPYTKIKDLGMVSKAKTASAADSRNNDRAVAVSYAIMTFLYKNGGTQSEAIEVAEMQQAGLLSDCASFNKVMASYATNGQLRECGELLHLMLSQKILPDVATYETIFAVLKKGTISPEAISQLESAYTDGKPFAGEAILASMFSSVGLHAFALESCGSFVTAEHAPDLFAYNVAISAFASAGETEKAVNLFMKMQEKGPTPDIVTYINLAGCYGKAGSVEGLERIYSKLGYGEIESNESLFRAVVEAYWEAGRPDLAELLGQEMRFNLSVEMESHQTGLAEQSDSYIDEYPGTL